LKADDRALADLAASVADGESVDWHQVESHAAARDLRLIRHLRLVDKIATLHRSTPLEEDLAGIDAAPVAEPTGPRWGRLVILEPIGRGTSCEVFRAWDSDLHREVALKLFNEQPSGGASETHAQVLREARRLARVRHPHVVQVYGAEQHDGRVGLWMELVRGESLEQVIGARGAYGASEAAILGQELCAALAAVHGAGLLHRDVKTQNVLRESGGRTVLMDFGTGEELKGHTGSAKIAGTPLYLAPEVFAGQTASVQSDLYSLGVLLFHLVTGQFPVTAGSIDQLARAHERRDGRKLRDLRPDLPAPFVAVVERALQPDPAARYKSAGDMEAGLRESAPGAQATAATPAWWRVFGARPAFAGLIVGVAAAAARAAIFWSRGDDRARPVASRAITSVAVLPLGDVSGPSPLPHLADALTDQLIGTLGQIRALRVASRTSVMPFKEAKPSLKQVFDTLGVDAIVEGTVAMVEGESGGPGRVRVNARLIAAGTGGQIWSASLERPMGDALILQADLARQIAQAVRAAVTDDESRRLNQARSTNAAAEEAYFLGRYHLGQFGIDRARRALEAFKRAVQFDPNHAAAHAGAARSYFNLGFAGAMSQPEARALGLAEVARALEIDADQVDAQVALGDLKFFYDWDWRSADAAYRRAIQLNESFAYARGQYARFLAAARRLDEAAAEARAAADLDPLSGDGAQTLGLVLYYKRDYDGALQALNRALELEPRSARARAVLGRVYDAQGQPDRAIEEMRQAMELADDAGVSWRIQVIRLQAAAGHGDEARAQLKAFNADVERRQLRVADEHLGYLRLALGDKEAALNHLDRAVRDRDPGVLWLAVDPRVDPLRQDPRFKSIVARLAIP
jgi:TolB-like protein/Tfp pilus assembly protein PilF